MLQRQLIRNTIYNVIRRERSKLITISIRTKPSITSYRIMMWTFLRFSHNSEVDASELWENRKYRIMISYLTGRAFIFVPTIIDTTIESYYLWSVLFSITRKSWIHFSLVLHTKLCLKLVATFNHTTICYTS